MIFMELNWIFYICCTEAAAPFALPPAQQQPRGCRTLWGSLLCCIPHQVLGYWSHWCAQGVWSVPAPSDLDHASGLAPAAAQALSWGAMFNRSMGPHGAPHTDLQPKHPLQQPAPPSLIPRSFQSTAQIHLLSSITSKK